MNLQNCQSRSHVLASKNLQSTHTFGQPGGWLEISMYSSVFLEMSGLIVFPWIYTTIFQRCTPSLCKVWKTKVHLVLLGGESWIFRLLFAAGQGKGEHRGEKMWRDVKRDWQISIEWKGSSFATASNMLASYISPWQAGNKLVEHWPPVMIRIPTIQTLSMQGMHVCESVNYVVLLIGLCDIVLTQQIPNTCQCFFVWGSAISMRWLVHQLNPDMYKEVDKAPTTISWDWCSLPWNEHLTKEVVRYTPLTTNYDCFKIPNQELVVCVLKITPAQAPDIGLKRTEFKGILV